MANRIPYGPWLAGAVLVASGAAVWFYYPRTAPQAEVPAAPPPLATAPVEEAPVVQHPIDQVPVLPAEIMEPVPALADSDAAALAALGALMGGADPATWFVSEFVVQRLVTTIDNLPRSSVTRQVYAAKPVAGTLSVTEADGRLWLDTTNYARYDTAVSIFESADSRQLVSAYVRFYPLLQQAWREVGAGGEFNDRLVQVIDHLLAAPELSGPFELQRAANGRPRMEFVDPRLEGASVGHKALMRIGPDHAGRVKAKLRELRGLLAGQRPKS
jgi:hypothetical protein